MKIINTIIKTFVKAPSETKAIDFKQHEFTFFSIFSFLAKSALLIRLPYRGVLINTIFTSLILVSFYCYLRFRQQITPPIAVMAFLIFAVAIDVLGNFFGLYGKHFFLWDYDEYTHFLGSASAFVPTFWLLTTTTRKFGHNLPLSLLAFFAANLTFSFCAYYEVLELWDEQYFGGRRLWSNQDSAQDLECGLAGIVSAALATVAVVKYRLKWKAATQLS